MGDDLKLKTVGNTGCADTSQPGDLELTIVLKVPASHKLSKDSVAGDKKKRTIRLSWLMESGSKL